MCSSVRFGDSRKDLYAVVWTTGAPLEAVASSASFSTPSSATALSAHSAKTPEASQPYATNGQWNGAAKNSSVIHRLWPHSFMATCIISVTVAAIRKKNDHGNPFEAA